jgi:hypothetical protein
MAKGLWEGLRPAATAAMDDREAGHDGRQALEVPARHAVFGRPLPMIGGRAAERGAITVEGYWMIAGAAGTQPGQIYGDGSGPGAQRAAPAAENLVAPQLKPWSLVARWCTQLPDAAPQAVPGLDWFAVGAIDAGGEGESRRFRCELMVPQSAAGGARVLLVYACNDDDLTDNTGYLRVTETWQA